MHRIFVNDSLWRSAAVAVTLRRRLLRPVIHGDASPGFEPRVAARPMGTGSLLRTNRSRRDLSGKWNLLRFRSTVFACVCPCIMEFRHRMFARPLRAHARRAAVRGGYQIRSRGVSSLKQELALKMFSRSRCILAQVIRAFAPTASCTDVR